MRKVGQQAQKAGHKQGFQNHPLASAIFDLQGQILKVKGQMSAKQEFLEKLL